MFASLKLLARSRVWVQIWVFKKPFRRGWKKCQKRKRKQIHTAVLFFRYCRDPDQNLTGSDWRYIFCWVMWSLFTRDSGSFGSSGAWGKFLEMQMTSEFTIAARLLHRISSNWDWSKKSGFGLKAVCRDLKVNRKQSWHWWTLKKKVKIDPARLF